MKTQIEQSRLDELLDIEARLDALEAGGVDNWDGYDFALEEYRKVKRQDEEYELLVDDIIEAIGEYVEEPAGHGCGYGVRVEGANAVMAILKSKVILKDVTRADQSIRGGQ